MFFFFIPGKCNATTTIIPLPFRVDYNCTIYFHSQYLLLFIFNKKELINNLILYYFTDFPTNVDQPFHTSFSKLLVGEKILRKYVCQ